MIGKGNACRKNESKTEKVVTGTSVEDADDRVEWKLRAKVTDAKTVGKTFRETVR